MDILINKFLEQHENKISNVSSYREGINSELIIETKSNRAYSFDGINGVLRKITDNINNVTEEESRKDFGMRLFRLMWNKGWTQRDLSNIVNIPQSQISRYLSGKSMPSVYVLKKIANTFNCTIDDLVY